MFFESLLDYIFEHNKQLLFGSSFLRRSDESQKDETAVYGWSCWLNPSFYMNWFTEKLI